MPPLGASVPPQGAVMVLNRWLLERDWCPPAGADAAVAGPIAVDRRWARTGRGRRWGADDAVVVGDGLDRARAAPRDSMRDDASRGVVGRLVDAAGGLGAAAGGRDAGVPDEPCLSPRVKRSTNSNELLKN